MSPMSASMKRIETRTTDKKRQHRFPPLLVYGDFFRRSRAANSAVGGLIWPNFELLPALMHVIVTCKYEKDRMKNSREKLATPFFPILTLWVICCHGNQSSDFSDLAQKPHAGLYPTTIMLLIKFYCDRPAGCGDIHV